MCFYVYKRWHRTNQIWFLGWIWPMGSHLRRPNIPCHDGWSEENWRTEYQNFNESKAIFTFCYMYMFHRASHFHCQNKSIENQVCIWNLQSTSCKTIMPLSCLWNWYSKNANAATRPYKIKRSWKTCSETSLLVPSLSLRVCHPVPWYFCGHFNLNVIFNSRPTLPNACKVLCNFDDI